MSQFERTAERLVLVAGLAALVTTQLLTFREQMKLMREMLRESRAENRRLTSLVLAKDPMTYATLETVTPVTPLASEYVSQGTDEAEARHWAAVMGQPVDDDLTAQDLEAMGLR